MFAAPPRSHTTLSFPYPTTFRLHPNPHDFPRRGIDYTRSTCAQLPRQASVYPPTLNIPHTRGTFAHNLFGMDWRSAENCDKESIPVPSKIFHELPAQACRSMGRKWRNELFYIHRSVAESFSLVSRSFIFGDLSVFKTVHFLMLKKSKAQPCRCCESDALKTTTQWQMPQSPQRSMTMNWAVLEEGGHFGKSYFRWKSTKPQVQTLQRLARLVILKCIRIHGIRNAQKSLPLPKYLLEYISSGFSLDEFEVQSCSLSRDKRVHCLYPTRYLVDGSSVILKCIHLKCQDVSHIMRLVEAWRRIDHKNITPVLACFGDRDALGVVFSPVPQTLHDLVTKYRKIDLHFPEWLVWSILCQVCSALLFLQKRQLDYGELRSKAISVTASGDVLLHNILMYTPSELELNVCVDVKDSFYGIYVAPERIRGGRHSEKQQSWAVGCLAYEMCFLEPAFYLHTGETVYLMLSNIVNGNPPTRLAEPHCRFSTDMTNFMKSCLMPEPKLRPQLEDLQFIAKKCYKASKPMP